jgi:two-component system response regulator FixJ
MHMMSSEESLTEIVCLVDDDPAVLKSMGRLLASDGFSVRAFGGPKSFLAHVESHRVLVAILDIWMEEMNGLEVQCKLCALSPETRVIIITGREDPTARMTAMRSGAVGFFIKPFDDNQFLAAVHSALAVRSSS